MSMMQMAKGLMLAGSLLAATPGAGAGEVPAEPFDALHRLIKPQPGESKWATIPWLTNLAEARRLSVKEDKPLFIWRAGGGEVLGRAGNGCCGTRTSSVWN